MERNQQDLYFCCVDVVLCCMLFSALCWHFLYSFSLFLLQCLMTLNMICQWTYKCHKNEKSLCHCSQIRQSKCLVSCQYTVTLHSVCVTWYKYGNSLDDTYCAETQAVHLMYAIYPFQKYKLTHYCMWDIDWKRLFRNVWIIKDTVDLPIFGGTLRTASAIVRPWLTAWSTTVALISPDMCLCPWPLCLFLCFASVRILTPLLPLVWWPWSFLDVHPSSECVTLVLSSVYMLSNWRVHEMHLHSFIHSRFVFVTYTIIQNITFELFQRTGL